MSKLTLESGYGYALKARGGVRRTGLDFSDLLGVVRQTHAFRRSVFPGWVLSGSWGRSTYGD